MDNLMELVYGAAGEDEYVVAESCAAKRDRLVELQRLGFHAIATKQLDELARKDKLTLAVRSGYVRIPEANIEAFLNRKVELYDRQFAHEPKLTEEQIARQNFANIFNPTRRIQTGALNLTIDNMVDLGFSATGLVVNLSAGRQSRQVSKNSITISSDHTCHFYKNEGIGKFVWTETPIADYEGIPPRHALEALKAAQEKAVFDYFTIASVNAVQDPLLLGRINDNDDRFFIAQWDTDVCLDDLI